VRDTIVTSRWRNEQGGSFPAAITIPSGTDLDGVRRLPQNERSLRAVLGE
jgi:hypothetical protein